MPGRPGWCAVNRSGVPENCNTVAEKVCIGNGTDSNYEGKRMMIHDTAFVAWCYEKKSMLDECRNQ